MEGRLDKLKKSYLENEIAVQKAEREAGEAERLADSAEQVSVLDTESFLGILPSERGSEEVRRKTGHVIDYVFASTASIRIQTAENKP